ncbi:MAG: M13 family peptidase, partial [Acidobacteriota bacterium]|nr:M13 family peptidase [Acidobacteriota bacterium]
MRANGAAALVLGLFLSSGSAAAAPGPADAPPAAATRPGFDPGLIDKTVKPCNDFFQFACGGWLAANPVPPEYAIWGRFNELADRNQQTLKKILEAAASAKKRDAIRQKIGDFYASCMEEAAAEAAGIAPLAPELERIARIQDVA